MDVPICVSVPPGALVRDALNALAIPKSVTTAASSQPGSMPLCRMIGAAAGFRFVAGERATPSLEATPNLTLSWIGA